MLMLAIAIIFLLQSQGFMVGVEVNPVKGLPSGFPVIMLNLSFNRLSIRYECQLVIKFIIRAGIA